MDSALRIVIPGPVVPKQRPRRGANGRWYTPARTQRYERHVGGCAAAAMLARRSIKPSTERVRVTVDVYWPDARRRDVDNAAKSILDGMNGVVWVDDSQVAELTVRAHLDRESPRAEVVVQEVEQ